MSRGDIYYVDGDLVAEHGEIKVYSLNEEFFMEQSDRLIYSDQELSEYIWQISDKPVGKCLMLGLGLGVATKYVLSLPKAESVTVVESSEDIIKAQAAAGLIYDDRLTVLHEDYLTYLYTSKEEYDFIFIDCYSEITTKTFPLIADLVAASKRRLSPNGIFIGWLNMSTKEDLIEPFYRLFVL